uniref:TNFR-Cys domain-containing protein n=1 Tax=Cyprinodon variegatus TaxID=28743 RepID=A0A3Q2CPE6_CYPVA
MDPRCDQTEFLHQNGTCVECPVCKPGEQLSGDCGFGYGGDGVCILCERGTFSTVTGVEPCRRCTQCNLLNRHMLTDCFPTSDTMCGKCLPGRYYELKSMTGEVELLCIPCESQDTLHKECRSFASRGSKAPFIESKSNVFFLTTGTSIPRGQNSLNHESELHPASIVINVTTNIKPCSQKQDNIMQDGQTGFNTEENLAKILSSVFSKF